MYRYFLIIAVIIGLASCKQGGSGKLSNPLTDTAKVLSADQKMDTAYFWTIMDKAFEAGRFNNAIKAQSILDQLVKLTPQQIVDFEIIFQQKIHESNTWNNLAAQTIIEGGSSDDRFYYFRCWLISLGKRNFDETLKNPDHLASLDIPINKQHHYGEVSFEDLIGLSDLAYGIVTKKDINDASYPRAYASSKGLYFDSGGETKGKEWKSNDELPTIAPLLCKKFKIE